MTLEQATEEMWYHTDRFPWYWLSYGEKCYAFACVEAVPVNEGDPYPEPGSRLDPHPENDRTWVGENGTEMMTMDTIAQIERQNGDTICRFLALAHAHLCHPELS